MKPNVVLAITGASGAAYAVRLLEVLLAGGYPVYLTISPAGSEVLRHELNVKLDLDRFDPQALFVRPTSESSVVSARGDEPGQIHYCHYQDLLTPIASGSFLTAGMVVCPCSGSTLGAIANAVGNNLVHRAAEVHLKERRKLIVVPRETPLSLPQIDNMRKLTEAGAIVLPASPGFYHCPKSMDDLVDFVVARICDQLGMQHSLVKRWGESK